MTCSTDTSRTPVLEVNGFRIWPEALDAREQAALVEDLRDVAASAPFYVPRMPRTGTPFSVRMTNCGPLGWVADKGGGYRYQPHHPDTGAPWPAMPGRLLEIWRRFTGWPHDPEAGLVNLYREGAKMGLHTDSDEDDREAPVLSISLGDTAVFRMGGPARRGSTRSVKLPSGAVVVMGGPARFHYHGVDRILPGSSGLLTGGGRLNVTLRRVTPPLLSKAGRIG